MSDLISKRSATERLILAKTLLESVLQDIPRWIHVNEILPKRCSYVLITDGDTVCEAYYDSDGRFMSWDGNKFKDVTAWIPLPKPYTEGMKTGERRC